MPIVPFSAHLRSLVTALLLTAVVGKAQATTASLTATRADAPLLELLRGSSASLALGEDAATEEKIATALSDYKTLVQVLYDQGYFAPVISINIDGIEASRIDFLQPPRSVTHVEIAVDPGEKFVFGDTSISPLPQHTELEFPGFASGQPASTDVLQRTASAALTSWQEAGHPKAALAPPSITANARSNQLHAHLKLRPGPQLRFGALRVADDSAVDDTAIQAIAGFPSGVVYHPELLNQAASRLRRTGAFSSVSITEAESPNPDGTLDYDLTVEDQKPRRLTFSAEISTSQALSLGAGWIHRNLWGGAERLRLELDLTDVGTSEVDGTASVRLERPGVLGVDRVLFYQGALATRKQEHYSTKSISAGIGFKRRVSDTTEVEAMAELQHIRADDAYGTDRKFNYISLHLRAEKDLRDDRTSATDGTYLAGEVQPFLANHSGGSGVRLNVEARAYRRLGGSDRFVVAGRLQTGAVVGPNADSVAPALLFYSGGAGSVRGQEFQSLGISANGGTAGGLSYLALSGELRAKITSKISIVGFYDYGLVGNKSLITKGTSHHAGAGLGLRYDISGIGPLRLDLAVPTSGDTNDGLQFYLGIGQAF